MVYLFNVGDLVTCKVKRRYAVTDYNKPLRVEKLGSVKVGVRTLFGDRDLFWLNPDNLRFMSEKEIFKNGEPVTIEYYNNKERATFLEYCDYSILVERLNGDIVNIPSYWILDRAGNGGIYV